MIFKQIRSGGDRNFAYLIADDRTRKAVLIDPSPDPLMVMDAIKDENVSIELIINTHSHIDHSAGNDCFSRQKGNKITLINSSNETRPKDGQAVKIGDLTLEIMATPGHTPDSICIRVEDKLITGDTLFVGKVGGTWSRENARQEFQSLKKIISLDPDTEVWPGHDYGLLPNSTIGYEIRENPFIKRLQDFEEFLNLKGNWAQYKKEHGLK
jgi:hydroxyacylglutathione hydrolase